MENTTQIDEKKETIFDPKAQNRFGYSVEEDGRRFDVAHIFAPVSDERYLQYLKEFNISGDEENVKEEGREASVRLWDDVILKMEGVETDGDDWKKYLPSAEKEAAVADLLAVAIGETDKPETTSEADTQQAPGKRVLGPKTEQKVFTECLFHEEILRQCHVMQPVTLELEKKYARIAAKRFRREQVRGFRQKTTVTYVPQDKAFGELYDEMMISTVGFAGNEVPLRFKTTVVHHIFGNKIEPKSLGK